MRDDNWGGRIFDGCMEPFGPRNEAHQTVRIPVTGSEWHVVDGIGKEIPSQVQAIDQRTLQLPLLVNHYKVTKEQLPKSLMHTEQSYSRINIWNRGIPAMGYKVFTAKASSVKTVFELMLKPRKATLAACPTDGPTTVSNGIYELTLDPTTGMTATLKNIKLKFQRTLKYHGVGITVVSVVAHQN